MPLVFTQTETGTVRRPLQIKILHRRGTNWSWRYQHSESQWTHWLRPLAGEFSGTDSRPPKWYISTSKVICTERNWESCQCHDAMCHLDSNPIPPLGVWHGHHQRRKAHSLGKSTASRSHSKGSRSFLTNVLKAISPTFLEGKWSETLQVVDGASVLEVTSGDYGHACAVLSSAVI